MLAGVCLALAAASGPSHGSKPAEPVFLPVRQFTLAWNHSIEKTRWEEDYLIETDAVGGAPKLVALAARVRGSGAGMEPPEGAVLRRGWYEFPLVRPALAELLLTRSGYTADYEWCEQGRCTPMAALLPSDGGVTRLWACRRAG
jgi:hypothetical protein